MKRDGKSSIPPFKGPHRSQTWGVSSVTSRLHGEPSHAKIYVVRWLRSFLYARMPTYFHLGALTMVYMTATEELGGEDRAMNHDSAFGLCTTIFLLEQQLPVLY